MLSSAMDFAPIAISVSYTDPMRLDWVIGY